MFSYGREDLLAMRGKDGMKPPAGIEKCPFFVESSLTPVVLLPFTEIEMVPFRILLLLIYLS